jgi:putative spermidine/putrescine transport system substrate-binding protein
LPIKDWSDLLDPRLKGRVAFMESPRELVGVALKTLGLGYNARRADLAAAGASVEDLRTRIKQLCAQVS